MKYRSPIAATLLAVFVPFYMIYWLYQTGKTFQNRGIKAPSRWLLFGPLLFYLAAVVLMLAANFSGNDAMQKSMNIAGILSGLIGVLGILIGSLLYYVGFSKATETYTQHQLSTVLLVVLLLFFSPIAVYLVQDKVNQIESGQLPGQPLSPQPPYPQQPPYNPVQ